MVSARVRGGDRVVLARGRCGFREGMGRGPRCSGEGTAWFPRENRVGTGYSGEGTGIWETLAGGDGNLRDSDGRERRGVEGTGGRGRGDGRSENAER